MKRKNIRTVALGDKFAVALGKDVSVASLRKKKAAKARKMAQLRDKNANSRNSRGPDNAINNAHDNQPLRA